MGKGLFDAIATFCCQKHYVNRVKIISSLPGKEALYDPGKRNGQMKMVRDGQTVIAYTWVEDGENSHWDKIGEVLGGSDKDENGRTVFEGEVINT